LPLTFVRSAAQGGGKDGPIDVNLQPVALTQKGLGLIVENRKTKSTKVVTAGRGLKIDKGPAFNRDGREAADAEATIWRSLGANDVAECETFVLSVEPAVDVQILVGEHSPLLEEGADVALFGLEEVS
jgi:hypothetical protein